MLRFKTGGEERAKKNPAFKQVSPQGCLPPARGRGREKVTKRSVCAGVLFLFMEDEKKGGKINPLI